MNGCKSSMKYSVLHVYPFDGMRGKVQYSETITISLSNSPHFFVSDQTKPTLHKARTSDKKSDIFHTMGCSIVCNPEYRTIYYYEQYLSSFPGLKPSEHLIKTALIPSNVCFYPRPLPHSIYLLIHKRNNRMAMPRLQHRSLPLLRLRCLLYNWVTHPIVSIPLVRGADLPFACDLV